MITPLPSAAGALRALGLSTDMHAASSASCPLPENAAAPASRATALLIGALQTLGPMTDGVEPTPMTRSAALDATAGELELARAGDQVVVSQLGGHIRAAVWAADEAPDDRAWVVTDARQELVIPFSAFDVGVYVSSDADRVVRLRRDGSEVVVERLVRADAEADWPAINDDWLQAEWGDFLTADDADISTLGHALGMITNYLDPMSPASDAWAEAATQWAAGLSEAGVAEWHEDADADVVEAARQIHELIAAIGDPPSADDAKRLAEIAILCDDIACQAFTLDLAGWGARGQEVAEALEHQVAGPFRFAARTIGGGHPLPSELADRLRRMHASFEFPSSTWWSVYDTFDELGDSTDRA